MRARLPDGARMTDSGTKPEAAPGGYSPGDVVAGKYRLDAVLGEGGQALVWRARNLALEADVALKLVRPDSEDRAPVHRLLREARAAARLDHPAIVRVFDLGETEAGDPFLVMELLSGEDLADLLVKRRQLPAEEAVQMLLPIADALVSAHAQGIIHRDLKPANVFLARNGEHTQPKLLDFGIVKLRLPASPNGETITNDGVVIGSLAYLSPEQARGLADIDERADVWCFCAMLYECLTGETPFQGTSYHQLLRSITDDEPRSILEQGVADEQLWVILSRGLAKPTDERWQTVQELGSALARWLIDRGVTDDISGVSLSSRWLRHSDPVRSASATTVSGVAVVGAASARSENDGLSPTFPVGRTTEGSFSSRPNVRSRGSAHRRWLAIGGTTACIAVLGAAVDRLVRSGDGEAQDLTVSSVLAASVAPVPKAFAASPSTAEPRVVPDHRARLPAPADSAPGGEATPGESADLGTAERRTLPVSPPTKSDTGAQSVPAPARAPAPSPRPVAKPTDLLDPY